METRIVIDVNLPTSALTLIRAAGEPEDTHTATAWRNLETMCADLEREVERLRVELDDLSSNDNPRRNKKVRNQRKEIKELHRILHGVIKERNALRARIDAAEQKFDAWVNSGLWHWHAPGFSASPIWADVCDALNYNKPIAPIADAGDVVDERRGERRKGKERVYHSSLAGGKYFDGERNGRSVYGSADMRITDRRRTAGTRADRKA
jgi:hypothetical protein